MQNQDKSILIIGAGNIGRGVIGSLFYQSGYKLVIYDIMAERMKKLAEQGKYLVERVGEEKTQRIIVDNFEVLDCSDTKELIERITTIDLVACCVYEGAFESICKNISEAIKRRVTVGKSYLNVLLCVNALGAPEYFNKQIENNLVQNAEALNYFHNNVGICQVLVGTAGLPSPKELLAADPFAVTTRLGGYVGIDREHFKGQFPEVESVSRVEKANDQIYRKVYTGNMKHTMTAFMGKAKEYEFIADCNKDPYIQKCVTEAFYEAEEAIQREFNFSSKERQDWINGILNIKNTKLKDPISRVAANPMGKLSYHNRFVGPALMCIKHHIVPFYLARGIAYGFLYRDEEDQESIDITNYVQEKGIENAIDKYCGLKEEDWFLKELVKKHYEEAKYRKSIQGE